MPHIFSLLTNILMADPESDLAAGAAGTGAFRLEAFTAGDTTQLVRNEQYWRTGRPYLDRVTIKALTDANSAALFLETRNADVIQCAINDVPRLRAGKETTAEVLAGSGSYDMLVSAADPPFTDLRVRQAIDLALDRERFAEKVTFGLTRATYTMWIGRSPVWDASLETGAFNLDKARQLLADAGYAGGFETTIQTNNAYPELVQFDEIVQADLAKIGITARIEALDVNQSQTLVTQGKFHTLINHAYAYGDQDPAMQFTAFVFRPTGNASRFQSDQYQQMVDAARREPDWTKRLSM